MPIAGMSPKEVVKTEMHKWKAGNLHSGSQRGPVVRSQKQAIAIALSEARRAKRAAGGGLSGLASGFMSGVTPASLQAPMGAFNALPSIFGGAISQIAGMGGQPSGTDSQGQAAAPQPSAGQTLGQAALPPTTAPAATSSAPIAGLGTPSMSTMASPPPDAAPAVQPPAPAAIDAAARPANSPAPSMMGAPSAPGYMNSALGAYRPPGRQFGGGMTHSPNPSWTVRNEARSMLHSGPISSIVPGRTDRHNVNVGSGAYVMPADAVSHLGQNNTKAGQAILSHMFGGQGPYGMGKDMAIRHGAGPPKPPAMQKMAAPHIPSFGKSSGFQSAGGGKGDKTGEPVPIVVAGGEFTIPPDAVAAVGGGDIKRGHRLLDKWVLSLRQKHIATLKGLPPPAKS